MKYAVWFKSVVTTLLSIPTQSFFINSKSNKELCHQTSNFRLMASEISDIEGFLDNAHDSGLKFRVVVVGNGAILETTEVLGPVMKRSESPKSGDPLITFASSDSSFEFHLNLSRIDCISFVERNTMKICRLLNNEGISACSLILVDSSDEANKWFTTAKEKYATGNV